MDITGFDISEVKNIRDLVYETLRNSIIEGKLKPGERIVEKKYAEMFNISRTPVREALRKLEIEGFLEYVPRKGDVVRGFCLNDVEEIYAIRTTLEILAVKAAIKNISQEELDYIQAQVDEMDKCHLAKDMDGIFHACKKYNDSIYNASRMPILTNMINTLREYVERIRRITLAEQTHRSEVIHDHRMILDAIAEKDAVKAEALIVEHLERGKEALLRGIKADT